MASHLSTDGLYGLDPTKKETTPGIPDSVAINKLKAKENDANQANVGTTQNEENLTQTDKFSRELFSSTAALNQSGAMDQTTADQLGSSLASKIQNTPVRKVFLLSDIKIINDNTPQAIKEYGNTAGGILKKYPIKTGVLPILQKFMNDETNFAILLELDPITNQMNKIIEELVKMNVPQSISLLHLDFINSFQRIEENVEDMKLFEKDIIVALSGINQFEKNIAIESVAFDKLTSTIMQIE